MERWQRRQNDEPRELERRAFLLAGLMASLGAMVPIRALAAPEPGAIPILAYHRFDPARPGPTTVTVKTFESQVNQLAGLGYRVVRLREAIAALHRPATGTTRRAAITVDDGHRSVYAVLFPLIRKHSMPVTLFIYPSAIANADYAMTWDQLREMQDSGLVDVQSHTYWHPNFNVERRRRSRESYRAFVDDQLLGSKAILEARLGKKIDILAWPFGIVNAELEMAARHAGYVAAVAYQGGPARPGVDLLALPRIPIGEADRGVRFEALIGVKGKTARQ